jgi:hypothetical protein
MNDNDGFSHEHDESAEQHGDTWVAGSESVAVPGDEATDLGSSEGASGWGHGTEHTTEAGETDGGRAWDAPNEEAGTEGEAGTTEGGAFGDHEGHTEGDTEGSAFGDHEGDPAVHDADALDGTATTHDDAVADHDTVTDEAPATDTSTITDNGAPPAADTAGEQIEHLIDPAESDRFHAAWREIQSGFVDDPRDAVHQASTLAEEVLNALSTALKSRVQAVEEGWQGGDGAADTERLRIALRGYRALLDQVLAG